MQSPPLPENLQKLTSPHFFAPCPICNEGWREVEHGTPQRFHNLSKHGLGEIDEAGNTTLSAG